VKSGSIRSLARYLHRVPDTQGKIVRVGVDDAVQCSCIVMIDGDGTHCRAIGYRMTLTANARAKPGTTADDFFNRPDKMD
jgi:hypothetical protein